MYEYDPFTHKWVLNHNRPRERKFCQCWVCQNAIDQNLGHNLAEIMRTKP